MDLLFGFFPALDLFPSGLGEENLAILVAASLLALGVLASAFADRFALPTLVLFLGIGMLLGEDALQVVKLRESDADANWVQGLASVCLILIIYQGGLSIKVGAVRTVLKPATLLATAGVLITAAIVAGSVLLVGLPVPKSTALLLGAIVASTDASAVFSLLRQTPLKHRLNALLEVEAGGNDPMAIALTVGILVFVTPPSPPWWEAIFFTVAEFGVGLIAGAISGWLGSWMLRKLKISLDPLYPVLALSVAGIAYGLAENLGGSGFLAVFTAALLMRSRIPSRREQIMVFHEGLATVAQFGLFLLLGLLVDIGALQKVFWQALFVAAILALVARPFAVGVLLPWFGYKLEEIVLVSWAGVRGAVPIVLATYPLAALPGLQSDDLNIYTAALIFNIVFVVVVISALVQGLSIGSLARRLHLTGGSDGRPEPHGGDSRVINRWAKRSALPDETPDKY